MDQRGFFAALYGDMLPGEQINVRAFSARSGKRGYHEFCTSIDAAIEFIQAVPSDLEIYVGVNLRKNRDGTKEGVTWVRVFHADVDYKWFTSAQDARDQVIGFVLEPGLVVDTGNGLHAYWFLETPLGPDQFDLAESLMRRLYYALGGLDAVQDVSRILRVPDTFNNKDPRNRKRVKVIFQSEVRHAVEEFDRVLPQPPVKLEYTEKVEYLGNDETVTADFVRELLKHIDPCRPYGEYISIWGAVAYYFPGDDGLKLVDEWSSERRAKNGQFSSPRTQPEKHAGFRRQIGKVATIGTLVHHALEGGWQPPERPVPSVVIRNRQGAVVSTVRKVKEEVWRKELDSLPNPSYDDLPHYLRLWYDHLGELTEPFPRDVTTAMALTFGSLLWPRVLFENLRLNVWLMMLAEQGSGKNRLSDAMFDVIKLLKNVRPALYTSGTAEGMFTELDGDGKQMLAYMGEMGDWLSTLSRDYMKNARGVFCNLYDGRPVSHLLSKKATKINDPYLVIVGTTTPLVAIENLTRADLEGGFASRFAFVTPDYQLIGTNSSPTPQARQELADALDQHISDHAQVRFARFDVPRGSVPRAYRDYEVFCGVGTGEWRSFVDALDDPKVPQGRLLARVKKYAANLELHEARPQVDGDTVIVRDKNLELAITLVKRLAIQQQIVITSASANEEERALNAVQRAIDKAGDDGITRQRILQMAHVKARDLNSLLPLLEEAGLCAEVNHGGKMVWKNVEN